MEYQQILVVPLDCLFCRLSDNHAAHQQSLPWRSTNKNLNVNSKFTSGSPNLLKLLCTKKYINVNEVYI